MQLDRMYENLMQLSSDRNPVQEESFKKALGLPLPTSKNERWKFTPLTELNDTFYRFLKGEGGALKKAIDFASQKEADFLLYRDKVITLSPSVEQSAGVQISPFVGSSIHVLSAENIWDLAFREYVEKNQQFFDHMQVGLSTKGLKIEFNKSWSGESIKVLHLLDGHSANEYETSELIIKVAEGVNASVIEEVASMNEEKGFLNLSSYYLVDEGASLDHLCQSRLSETQMAHMAHFSDIKAGGRLNSFYQEFGGQKIKKNIFTHINGQKAEAQINGLVLSKGGLHVDVYAELKHKIGDSQSRQLFKGAVYDSSVVVINGCQVVDHGADLTDSAQLTKILQMDKKSFAYSKPQLEVSTDDVSAMHGATVGQIDKGELFYLLSRGINRNQAEVLLARGFISEPVFRIQNRKLQRIALEELDRALSPVGGEVKNGH